MDWGGEGVGPREGFVCLRNHRRRSAHEMASRFRNGLLRGSLTGLLVLWIGASAPVAASAGSPAIAIRVLIVDQATSVLIDGRVRRGAARFEAPGPHEVDGRQVRGSVTVIEGRGGLRVVNELMLEDYVAGTLLGEVSEGFGDVVLRAQAVATRTYALHRRAHPRSPDFDVEASTTGQVYLGMSGETASVGAAVDATRGQILTFGGEPILAAFHSAAGGRTATAAEVWGRAVPYLVSVGVRGEDDSPDTYWRAPVDGDAFGAALAAAGKPVGRVRDVTVAERTPSGRSAAVRIRGDDGEVSLSGEDLRRVLGPTRLKSTLFEVRRTQDGFVFVGSGNGHGVGMSQWGARALARSGSNHRQILAHFYPGTRIEPLSSQTARSAGTSVLAASTGVLGASQ
jgi:stage II sporulation protein D